MEFNDIVGNLSTDEKAEYHALLKLFESEGWAVLLEQFAQLRVAASEAFYAAPSWEANRVIRGRIEIMEMILAYEQGIEHYFALLAEERIEQKLQTLAEADRSME